MPTPTGVGESSTLKKKSEFQNQGALAPTSSEDDKERPINSDTRPKEGLTFTRHFGIKICVDSCLNRR